jgi:MYXO-CTERM domain-containing protein
MKFIASGLAAATLASAASADITVTLTNQTFAGFNFNQIMDYAGGREAVGTLTALSINMTLNASAGFAYADDICIYVDPLPLGTGGRLQVGGFSNLQAAQRLSWPNGGSSAPGTTVTGTVNLTTALAFIGNDAIDGVIWVGNGYGGSGSSGTWSGTITLIGIDEVPAPGALALLGVAGLSARRRRR